MKWLKRLSFSLLGILIVILIIATFLEKVLGTSFVAGHIYASRFFIGCWGMMVLLGILYIFKRKLYKRKITFLFHLSFVVILLGAFTTHLFGKQGMLHLREKEKATAFVNGKGETSLFPFNVMLDGFQVIYYPGTPSPMDYESSITIIDEEGRITKGHVSMNNIFSYKSYRFYQSGYDDDGLGTTLAVSYDPYGIAITYTGYGLLLLSILLFFIIPESQFRRLIKSPVLRKSAVVVLTFICFSVGVEASGVATPKVLPKEVAASFGDLYVLYNNRICPLQTLAKDFTTKLYGKQTYRGLTAEQVFTGWMFYYSSWKEQPMIRIKNAEVRHLLDTDEKYASLDDFINQFNEYKLDAVMHEIRVGENVPGKRGIEEADEKYNILRIFYSGEMMKIFPCRIDEDATNVKWFSQGETLPLDMEEERWFFIRKTQDYIHEMVVKKDYDGILYTLQKIKEYQQKEAVEVLPSVMRFETEKVYNQLDYTRLLAMICLTVGLLSFMYYCIMMAMERHVNRVVAIALNILLLLVWTYLTITIALRGVVSGHLPLSNGYETMQFMAWCSLLLAFVLRKKYMFLPFGLLTAGLTLLVSMMGESNPQITQLMPVLSSPLLSIHVVVIMIAYALFAFMMLNGLAAFIIRLYARASWELQVERLQIVSRIILYPALFCLIAGIFVGAVWANISWGRYWGWDPKEVWALITMLVYSLAIHTSSLPWFRKPMFFHVFAVVAFLSVLVTYFGVNFILGGMHSYA